MERLQVALGARSYEILIDGGLLAGAGDMIGPLLPRPFTVIVTDETVAGLHLGTLQQGLSAAGIASEAIVLPARRAHQVDDASDGCCRATLGAEGRA